jgi:endonuclease-3
VNAEVAFEALRTAYPSGLPVQRHVPGEGWGGVGLSEGAPPDWERVEFAPLPELTDVIRPGGLANQKAPRLQATLRRIREERGDYSLEFLGDMSALEAATGSPRSTASARRPPRCCCCSASAHRSCRSTATSTASCTGRHPLPGQPPMEDAHELVLGLFEPDQMFEAHVNLISTAARSATPSVPPTSCARCASAAASSTRRRRRTLAAGPAPSARCDFPASRGPESKRPVPPETGLLPPRV